MPPKNHLVRSNNNIKDLNKDKKPVLKKVDKK
jgi:hypothetical protein